MATTPEIVEVGDSASTMKKICQEHEHYTDLIRGSFSNRTKTEKQALITVMMIGMRKYHRWFKDEKYLEKAALNYIALANNSRSSEFQLSLEDMGWEEQATSPKRTEKRGATPTARPTSWSQTLHPESEEEGDEQKKEDEAEEEDHESEEQQDSDEEQEDGEQDLEFAVEGKSESASAAQPSQQPKNEAVFTTSTDSDEEHDMKQFRNMIKKAVGIYPPDPLEAAAARHKKIQKRVLQIVVEDPINEQDLDTNLYQLAAQMSVQESTDMFPEGATAGDVDPETLREIERILEQDRLELLEMQSTFNPMFGNDNDYEFYESRASQGEKTVPIVPLAESLKLISDRVDQDPWYRILKEVYKNSSDTVRTNVENLTRYAYECYGMGFKAISTMQKYLDLMNNKTFVNKAITPPDLDNDECPQLEPVPKELLKNIYENSKEAQVRQKAINREHEAWRKQKDSRRLKKQSRKEKAEERRRVRQRILREDVALQEQMQECLEAEDTDLNPKPKCRRCNLNPADKLCRTCGILSLCLPCGIVFRCPDCGFYPSARPALPSAYRPLNPELLCKYCSVAEATVSAFKCNHLYSCSDCKDQLEQTSKCPICGEVIRESYI